MLLPAFGGPIVVIFCDDVVQLCLRILHHELAEQGLLPHIGIVGRALVIIVVLIAVVERGGEGRRLLMR